MAKTTLKVRIVIAVSAIAGTAFLVVAGVGIWDYFKTTQTGVTVPTASQTITKEGPTSEKPVVVSDTAYTVPANQPRVIAIPKLNVTAYTERVGLEKSGAMATPNNINFAGWYVNSEAPGNSGVSIINGHAGGRYTQGIFRHISQLVQGDVIKVQMGNMSWRQFSVVSTKTYPVDDAAVPLMNDDSTIDKELHLITCDGTFNDSQQSYDKRTIVVAKYIEP